MIKLLTGRPSPFASFSDPPAGRLGGVVNLLVRHGYARGEAFEHWFDEQLNGARFADVSKAAEGTQILTGVLN